MSAKFTIEVDWIGHEVGFDDPAEKATAAKIKFIVDGINIAANDKSQFVEWHAMSIAEWMCRYWEKILFASKPPLPISAESGVEYERKLSYHLLELSDEKAERVAEKKQDWWRAHSLRGGRDGGAFPEIIFWPMGNRIGISWISDPSAFARTQIKFTPQPGYAVSDLADIIPEFERFLDSVIRRLDECGVTGERADSIKAQRAALGSGETKLKAILEYMGINPGAFHALTGVSVSEAFTSVSNADHGADVWRRVNAALKLGGDAAPSFEKIAAGSAPMALFRSASPRITAHDVHQLKTNCLAQPRNDAAREKLQDLARRTEERIADAAGTPFIVGYRKAQKFRSVLQISRNKMFDIERVLVRDLGVAITACALTDRDVDAVSLWDENNGPVICENKSSFRMTGKWSRRMALAHELCHLLFDSDRGRELGVASGDWAPAALEQTANAFAAELLVPELGLNQFNVSPLTPYKLKRICDHYQVGHTVVANRLADLGIVSRGEAQNALDGLFKPGRSRRVKRQR